MSHRYKALYSFYKVFLALNLISRFTLFIRSYSEFDLSFINLIKIVFVGAVFDTLTYLVIIIPFVLVLMFISEKYYKSRFRRKSAFIIYSVLLILLIFNNISEYFFWDEFGVRYNFIAVDYLIYTTEVLNNIYESYSMTAIAIIMLLGGSAGILLMKRYKVIPDMDYSYEPVSIKFINGVLIIVSAILMYLFIGVSFSKVSPNKYNCELSKNGLYSLVHAFKVNTLNYNQFYLTKNIDNAFSEVKTDLADSDSVKYSLNKSIKRYINNKGEEKRHNVFLINVESLSAEYMSFIKRAEHIETPFLNNLAEKSLFFTNFYATGTRTVRGLEAITLSLPPTPGRSIVKRPKNENLFALGKVFNEKGYKSKFIYGGKGYFDNMNYFFKNNGYEIIDRTDINKDEITFSNAWGVCDQDLYSRAVKEADKMHNDNTPFFFHLMTTSNHRPYTFPDVGIKFEKHREGGVEYTDYALKQLFAGIKDKPWFDNTIFVIISDHCGGSAGRSELPIREYQIPLLIYSPEIIKPEKIDIQSCQIDFAPTLLGLLNWSYDSEFMGKDILKMKPEDGRAFIGNYQKLGYLKNDKLVVLSPQKKVSCFRFDRHTCEMEQILIDNDMKELSSSYYQLASYLFENRKNVN